MAVGSPHTSALPFPISIGGGVIRRQERAVFFFHERFRRFTGDLLQSANPAALAELYGIGFLEAIEAMFPQAHIQTCIVHLIRNSMTLASWKDRKELATALNRAFEQTQCPSIDFRPV